MKSISRFFVVFVLCFISISLIFSQKQERPEPPSTLGLNQGYSEFETSDFVVKIVKSSQTLAALIPKEALDFDFTPFDMLENRDSDGFFHLGDLTLRTRVRVRMGDQDTWDSYSTADKRQPVTVLPASDSIMASSDLTPTLPEDCPLKIIRSWEQDKGQLILKFILKNKTDLPVQIGAFGLPMIFNNILSRRSLEQAHETCSFFDPYIGQDAGYLQITRLSGRGPALLVVPEQNTPFEAYRILSEPMRPRQTFEGAFEWMVHSRAYADEEWNYAKPWNSPTAATLGPGDQRTYSVRFLKVPEIRAIEKTLIHNNRPVAIGIPGYILPMDQNGKLFLKHQSPLKSLTVEPNNAINIIKLPLTKDGWESFNLIGQKWGRSRLTATYEDGLKQSIHYYVIKPAAQVVEDLGNFLMTKQWYINPDDPFHRSPSVMSYDRSKDSIVEQEGRAWIAGLGDEGGSGSWVAAAMKQFGLPKQQELVRYEQFVNEVLWGGIQYKEGEKKYGVRKSLFYYEPDDFLEGYYSSEINWESWTSWDKEGAELVNRSYNYPHVAAAYWSLYRLARNNIDLVTTQSWDWFLDRAFQTSLAMVNFAKGHSRHGQMEGTVFVNILLDLQREGWTEKAAEMEKTMKDRADVWIEKAYPFGSEMAWDSTGQEEVYAWCKYFEANAKAEVSLNSILGYMPTVPHWGYNGNARRYWDFLYGGKIRRIERQLHHYGSGLNAIPVLSEYRDNPDDFYLLRVGYGGMMGALANIDQEGFASAAFHSFPSTLDWDAYSGDYGPNFFGHSLNTATYVIFHDEFGWQAFGGNVEAEGDTIKVLPLDSFRKRIYIASLGLWLTLDSGSFEAIKINMEDKILELGFSPSTPHTPSARLRIEYPSLIPGIGEFKLKEEWEKERGAFVIPLDYGTTWVRLIEQK
ncbi:DUF5695 domain-containing protein [Acidobacteriota bacterium]